MNAKTISIALSVLVVALLAMLLMQKGGYVSQSQEIYEKSTGSKYKAVSSLLDNIGASTEVAGKAWALACEIKETAKTAREEATLESKYFPGVKGSNNFTKKTRSFTVSSSYPYSLEMTYAKVDEEKGKDINIKTLVGLASINVNSLLGIEAEEEDEEEESEEAAAPAPAEEKAAAPAKGKKGKKR